MTILNTLNRPTIFAGLKRICDSEMAELHAMARNAVLSTCALLDEAEKQLLSSARRVANTGRSDGLTSNSELCDRLTSELIACGKEQALHIQLELEKHLLAEVQKLVPLAVTIDRLIEHLKLVAQSSTNGGLPDLTAAVPADEESLLNRLGRFRANLAPPEKQDVSVASTGPLSAFGAGIAAVASGVFSVCHALQVECEREAERADDTSAFDVGDSIKRTIDGNSAERRQALEAYVQCVFGELRQEVYAALVDAQKSLAALDELQSNPDVRLLSGRT